MGRARNIKTGWASLLFAELSLHMHKLRLRDFLSCLTLHCPLFGLMTLCHCVVLLAMLCKEAGCCLSPPTLHMLCWVHWRPSSPCAALWLDDGHHGFVPPRDASDRCNAVGLFRPPSRLIPVEALKSAMRHFPSAKTNAVLTVTGGTTW